MEAVEAVAARAARAAKVGRAIAVVSQEVRVGTQVAVATATEAAAAVKVVRVARVTAAPRVGCLVACWALEAALEVVVATAGEAMVIIMHTARGHPDKALSRIWKDSSKGLTTPATGLISNYWIQSFVPA